MPDGARQARKDRRRSFAVRLVLAGFLIPALSLVVAGVTGNVHVVFGYFVPALIGLAVATAVVVSGRLFLPAAVMAVLLTALYAMTGALELSHPESFADFVPAFLRVGGAFVALCGAVIGVAGRKRDTLGRPTRRHRTVALAGAALLVAGPVGSLAFDSLSSATVRNADGAIEVVTDSDEFEPDTFELERGERVRFLVRNADSYAHTFTVDDLAVDVYVGPGAERLVTFDVPDSVGSRGFVLSCAVTGHEDMLGAIRAA